jgi:serine phosphatase RsbU (regulator of sigma subunit)
MLPGDADADRTMFARQGAGPEGAVEPDTIGHYLVVLEGAEPGRCVEVDETTVTIGRHPELTLVLPDTQLSRRHACVSLVNGKVMVEDLGSTNGTFVDGERITTPRTLEEGKVLGIGGQRFRYERRSRREVERSEDLERDLSNASRYVLSLLPVPLTSGPVLSEWRFVPSAQLGGDAFGYYWLDPDTFVFYLFDVAGHGVGSAMHSVTVMNVLRQRALPQVDFQDPASVLSSLNVRFQMDGHSGLFFTMWYGVYRPGDRTLVCGSAGHHPAYLVPSDRTAAQPLGTPGLMVGVTLDTAYQVQRTTVPAGSALYLFSDGAFEIMTKDRRRWAQADFLPLLLEPVLPGTPDAERIYRTVRQVAGPGALDDDFSLMVLTFP